MANLNLLGAIGGIGPGIQQGLQMKKQFQDLEHGENKINQEYELNEYKIEEHRKRNRKIPLNTILEGRDPEEVEILSTYFNPIKDSDGNISYGDFEAFRTSDTKNQFELNMNVARMNASKRKAEESKSQIFTLGQGIEDEIGQINIQGNPVSIQQILQLPSEDRESLISSIPDIETQERVRNQIEQMKVAYLDYDKYVKAEGVYAHKTGLIKNKEDKLVPVRIGDQIIYVPSSKAEGMEVGKVDSGQNIKNVTLDLPDPNGVKHAGGTMWDLSKGKPGSSEAFIGPAKAPISPSTRGFDLSPERNTALTSAIESGRLNPDRINSRTASLFADIEITHEQNRNELIKTTGYDIGPLNYAGIAADIKSDTAAQTQLQKQLASMRSFSGNLKIQAESLKTFIKRKQKEYQGWFRTDIRIANLPLTKFRNMIAGSADEAILDTYLKEISAEIAKLSTGSTGSVAEVSASAREMWDKIHDPNLPMEDLIRLIDEIKHLADIRIQTAEEAKDHQARLTGTRRRPTNEQGESTLPPPPTQKEKEQISPLDKYRPKK